jgi:peptide/nickel transport system permease protein
MSVAASDSLSSVSERSTDLGLLQALRWAGEHKSLAAGVGILTVVVLAAVFAPVLAPTDPITQDLFNRLRPPSILSGGSSPYLLGSDGFGRDVLSRILYATRVSLVVVAAAIAVSGSTGILLGLMAGYYEGKVGTVIMRAVDMQMALPPILAAVTVIAVFGTSLPNLVIVLALSGWVTYTRIMYSETLSIKQMEYVLAARAVGASDSRIMLRHILRNAFGALIVVATLQVGSLILFEAALSFLGLGVPPPTPSLGSMLSEGRNVLAVAAWLATFPGLTIVFMVLGVNYLGSGLREILDPKLRIG